MTSTDYANVMCSIKEHFEELYNAVAVYDLTKADEMHRAYEEFMRRTGECLGIITACSKRSGKRQPYKRVCDNRDGEDWRDIAGYEGLYQVSSYGRVRSIRGKERMTLLRQVANSNGYYHVGLYKQNERKVVSVHRLVAEAFVPKPEGDVEVSHLDETRTNNRADNLAWVDHAENMNMPGIKAKREK